MLGVFANVPAFDSYFKTGFGIGHFKNALDPACLSRVSEFYKDKRAEIDSHPPIHTFDFHSEGGNASSLYQCEDCGYDWLGGG